MTVASLTLPESAPSGASRKTNAYRLGPDLAAVLLATLLLLVLLGIQVDFSALHPVGVFNDQCYYVTTARHWLDTGRYECIGVSAVVPDPQKARGVFYMPGYFACLVASYAFFGYGVWQSLLPSIVGFVVAEAAVFLAARRLYGRTAAFLAAAIFAASPLNQLYGFLAMTEIPFVAAAATAIAAFVWLPDRYRVWCGPLLLVLPFLFRETGAFVSVLFSALVWEQRGARHAGILFLSSTVLLTAIHQMPFSKDRPSLLAANFVENEAAKYVDAVCYAQIELSPSELLRRLPGRMERQLTSVLSEANPSILPVRLMHGGLLAIGPLGLIAGLRLRDGWLAGTSGVALCLVLASAAFYTCAGMTFSRMSMFVFAPVSILAGRVVARRLASPIARRHRFVCHTACIAVLAYVGTSGLLYCHEMYARLAAESGRDRQVLAAIDAVAPLPPAGAFVIADIAILPLYLIDHYPVEGAFLPMHDDSIANLQKRWNASLIASLRTFTPGQLDRLEMTQKARLLFPQFRFDSRRKELVDVELNIYVRRMKNEPRTNPIVGPGLVSKISADLTPRGVWQNATDGAGLERHALLCFGSGIGNSRSRPETTSGVTR